MSNEATLTFQERLQTDEDFSARITAALADKEGADATAALIDFSAEEGIDITPQELLALQNAMTVGDELSGEDLDAVAGGTGRLASLDLQTALQKQQRSLQTMSNVSKTMHDTAMAVIRKIR